MAQIRIPCLVGKPRASGVTAWYWQPSASLIKAGWRPLALGKDEGKAIAAARARNAEVELWKAGGGKPAEIRTRARLGTFGALIARYRRDVVQGTKPSGQPLLRPKTAEVYETSLKRLELWAGKIPIAHITPARVRELRDAIAKPVNKKHPEKGGIGHSAAFNMLRIGRQVMSFAESIDVIPPGSNPFVNFKLGAPPARRRVWEAEDEAAFIAAAYDLGLPSMALAIELGIYTAQREADLIAFTEPQFQELSDIVDPTVRERLADQDGRILGWRLVQRKTSTEHVQVELAIPFEPAVSAKVAAAIRANRARDRAEGRLLTHVIINERSGLPYAERHFIRTWKQVLEHAADKANRPAMRSLVWHDLRRTRVVRLRRRGMRAEMIAAITGHSPRSIDVMLKVYGPVDPAITAAAIAASTDPRESPAEAPKEKSA